MGKTDLQRALSATAGLLAVLYGLRGVLLHLIAYLQDEEVYLSIIGRPTNDKTHLIANILLILIGVLVMLGWEGIKSAAIAFWDLPKPKEPGETRQE